MSKRGYNDLPVKTWDVYYEGEWQGTVQEKTEETARLAAYSTYEPLDEDGNCKDGGWDPYKLSVTQR